MPIKIDIDPLSSNEGKKLQSFFDNVVYKKRFELETSMKKDDDKYRKKEALYKSYKSFYELMCNLNVKHITLVNSFKAIIDKLNEIKFKESVDTGRLLPSQVNEFKEIWNDIEELYKFFDK